MKKSNYRINRAFAAIAEWIDQADRNEIYRDEIGQAVVRMPAEIVAANEYIRSCGITSRPEYERRLKKAMLETLRAKVMPVQEGGRQ